MRLREPRVITCSEYELLRVGEQRLDQNERPLTFSREHLLALRRFADSRKPRPFDVDSDSIRFRQFVGVLAVGELTIEVLPKADENHGPEPRWRNALIQMLVVAGELKLSEATSVAVAARDLPLLDVFLAALLDGTEPLLWSGLDRAYASKEENLTAFKGRFLVAQNLRENLVHRERVFVEHAPYDFRTVANTVLRGAVRLASERATSPALRARARRQLEAFPVFESAHVEPERFATIPRRTWQRYGAVLPLAWSLYQGLAPDVQHGPTRAIGLLFDMNRLFENFVGTLLSAQFPGRVRRQRELSLWDAGAFHAVRRPDAVVDGRVVLDTKWKVPTDGRPASSDLDQMFVYAHRLDVPRAVLVYPRSHERQTPLSGVFTGTRFRCETAYVDLFEEGRLSLSKARRELSRIVDEPQVFSPTENHVSGRGLDG